MMNELIISFWTFYPLISLFSGAWQPFEAQQHIFLSHFSRIRSWLKEEHIPIQLRMVSVDQSVRTLFLFFLFLFRLMYRFHFCIISSYYFLSDALLGLHCIFPCTLLGGRENHYWSCLRELAGGGSWTLILLATKILRLAWCTIIPYSFWWVCFYFYSRILYFYALSCLI